MIIYVDVCITSINQDWFMIASYELGQEAAAIAMRQMRVIYR